MSHKIKLFFGFLILTSIALLFSGCARFKITKDATYNEYTDIKVCKMRNNWVRSDQGPKPAFTKTRQGPHVAFNLIQSTLENKGTDYFLEVKTKGFVDFAIGKYLMLDIDNGTYEKFDLSRTVAFGKYIELSSANDPYFASATTALTLQQVNQLMHAHSIQFSIQPDPGVLSSMQLTGYLTAQNFRHFRRFESICLSPKNTVLPKPKMRLE